MSALNEVQTIRDLAKQYVAITQLPVQDQRRDLWRRHNALKKTRPLVCILGGNAFRKEIVTPTDLVCSDPFFRNYEYQLRVALFRHKTGDDSIAEPWLTVPAAFENHPNGLWGLPFGQKRIHEDGDAWLPIAPMKSLDDVAGLVRPGHVIDEEATAERAGRIHDAVGDIVAVVVDRGSQIRGFQSDVSFALGMLRGIEQMLWDMVDEPEKLHALCAFLRDGVLDAHEHAEHAGDWRLINHQNQAMTYAEDLPDPAPDTASVGRDRLWWFLAAQEFASVSPAMHEEFLLRYQIPIAEKFGLLAYGCCEDLTEKIGMLRKIPNLRRIAVTPWADVRTCAERISTDYVISWRPNPAQMICNGIEPDQIRRIITDGMDACRGTHVDITLKDITTVRNRPEDLARWVQLVRDVSDEYT